MRDITSRADIEALINEFYKRLFGVPGMKPVFDTVDFEAHVPNIVNFWEFVLLDGTGYRTNVFEKHVPLPIQLHQFDEWLTTFTTVVREMFSGETADLAVQRATSLAFTFRSKWAAIKGS